MAWVEPVKLTAASRSMTHTLWNDMVVNDMHTEFYSLHMQATSAVHWLATGVYAQGFPAAAYHVEAVKSSSFATGTGVLDTIAVSVTFAKAFTANPVAAFGVETDIGAPVFLEGTLTALSATGLTVTIQRPAGNPTINLAWLHIIAIGPDVATAPYSADWSVPKTYVAKDYLIYADWNTFVIDNLNAAELGHRNLSQAVHGLAVGSHQLGATGAGHHLEAQRSTQQTFVMNVTLEYSFTFANAYSAAPSCQVLLEMAYYAYTYLYTRAESTTGVTVGARITAGPTGYFHLLAEGAD